jgi:RsmE family RNA methyltransferase
VNIILFCPEELGWPLPKRDERTLHLVKVLHKKAGDSFEAGVLGGNLGTGIIEEIKPDGSVIYSLDLQKEPLPRYPIRIAVGFPRPIQIRRLLRDISNMGLEAVDLIGTELGEKSYRDTKLLNDGGARAALIEGAVQARDTGLPLLSFFPSLEIWLENRPWEKLTKSDDKRRELPTEEEPKPMPLLVSLDNERPTFDFGSLSALGRSMVLAVGSERGWSKEERDELESSGFVRLSMGSRPLRTETACVAAAALALEKIGAWR